jgi:hypothetical protein
MLLEQREEEFLDTQQLCDFHWVKESSQLPAKNINALIIERPKGAHKKNILLK